MFVAYKFQLLKVSELLVAYQSFSDWNEGSEFKDQQDQKFTYMDQRRSKDQRSTCFTDQQIKVHQRSRFNKIKDQENQPEINFFQITDQKFKVQLFTDQITKLDLVRRKPSLHRILGWAALISSSETISFSFTNLFCDAFPLVTLSCTWFGAWILFHGDTIVGNAEVSLRYPFTTWYLARSICGNFFTFIFRYHQTWAKRNFGR